jgi:hypothetical protein
LAGGIRLVDFSQPGVPAEVAAFVPPAVADPAGESPTVTLV